MPALIVAAFLAAHALVHLAYASPRPPATASGPAWPFDLTRSRLLGPLGVEDTTLRGLGLGLLAVVLLGYAVGALSAAGVAPADWFAEGVLVGSVASAALLVVFFHPWLVLGMAIDLALVWATLVASWRPEGLPL